MGAPRLGPTGVMCVAAKFGHGNRVSRCAMAAPIVRWRDPTVHA